MAYIRQISLKDAVGMLRRQYEAALKRAGRIYQIVRLHSLDPQTLRASMQLYQSTTTRPDAPLSRAQREMIAVVVSRANDCFY